MTCVYIEGFYVEAHLPNQIHHQQNNKDTIGAAFDAIMDYYQSWGTGKIEQIILKPKYTLLPD
jgi:hypothetical protein